MTNRITLRAPLIRFILLTAFACFSWQSYAQCTTAGFGSYAGFSVDNSGAVQTWALDLWTDELSPGFGFIPGDEYEFSVTLNSDGTHKYITLVDSGGIVIASGLSPLTAIITDTDIEVYRHDDDGSGGCLGSTSFHTGTVQNLSVVPDPPPGNDLCADATPIACGDTIGGTNVSATDGDGVAGSCDISSSAVGVWYVFMGTGDIVTASVCNAADFDTEITVFTGACGDFSCVDNNDDNFAAGCLEATSELEFDSVAGTTYYIYVSGFGSATGSFDLSLTCVAPPACVPPTIDSSTVVDNCAEDGTFSVDIVVSDAGDAGSVISDGESTYPIVAGTVTAGPYSSGDTVTLTVDAVDDDCDSSLGEFTLTCPPPAPDNDECANATSIACGDTLSGTNVGATDAGDVAGDGCGTSSTAVGVWYAFMGTGDTVTASTCNPATDFDTEVTVYEGVCGDFSCVGNNDDDSSCEGSFESFGSPRTSTFTWESMVGTTYYIYVTGFSSGTGNFDLSLTCEAPPACVPPTIDSATIVDNCDVDGTFSVDVVVSDAGDAGTVISDGTDTYPVVAGTITVGPFNSGDNITLTVDATDDACDSSLGDFTVTCPPPAPDNDECANATSIACGDTLSGTNINATDAGDVAGDGCGTSSTAVGVWYAFMGTGDTVTASTCNPATDFDTEVTVYSGVCGDLSCVGNNDDDSSCEGSFESFGSPRTSTFTWESMVGTTYYIYVSGFGSGTGNFDLSLTCEAPPACVPPTIDSASIVDNCDVDGTFSVDVVVSDAGDAGTVISDGTNTYPVVAGTITVGPFNSGDNITLTVDATDDECDSSLGDFTVTCPPPAPDNDECANATSIACGDTISGTNVGATDAGGVAGGCSISSNAVGVWYAFMGTGDVVTASVCNAADFDTEITVFTGVCDDLTCFGNNDDNSGAGCTGNTSEFEFESMVGTTYYIYVSGFSSNVGTFDLSITCEEPIPAPDNDECEDATAIACGDSVMGSTANATNSGGNSGPDVFYSLDGAGAGDEVTVSLCGSSFDTVLTIFDACDGNIVASNDDSFSVCGNNNSNATFIADGSTTYLIRVDGFFGTSSGDYMLSITCEQPDPCEGGTTHEWTGTSDSSWMNAGNWLNGDAPGLMLINADVTIPAGAANYPELMSGQELYVDECSTLTVDDQATLTFNPNAVITNDGTVTNNGMTTFESDESGTAYVGSGTGMFDGDFTVERFIPAKRAYRQLSPAVTTSTPISDNWQQDTHITGPAGNTDGFDVTQTGNPSMYIFDNVAYDYVEVANTNATNLMPGTMYHILIRGDRTTDLTNNNATPSDTTLKTTGELTADNNGSQMISVNVPEQRFIAVGNPFQAQVDMNVVLTTDAMNISPNFYWVWDPTLGFRGAYTAIVASTGVASSADSDADQYLQAGQAGWVYTAGAGMSSVNFTQASKSTGVETDVFRNASSASLGQLRLSLYESTALSNNESAADGVLIMFDSNGNNDVDANDAPNITNLDENFAINNGGVLLSIENRAAPQDQEEIQLEINTYRNSNYTIVAQGISMDGATAFLLDTYTNVMTEIPQTGSVNYSYTVDTGLPGTIAGDRFKIVFTTSTLSVDDLDLGSIKLYPNPTNTGKFNINVPLGMDDLEVTIYSMLGVRLYNETGFNPGQRITIDTERVLSAGTYLVELSSNGKTATKKLIIN